MQIPDSVRHKRLLDNIFKRLDKAKKASEISAYLSVMVSYNQIFDRNQLQKVYSYANTRSRLIKESLAIALFTLQTQKAIDITIQLSKDRYTQVRYWAVFNLVEHIPTNTKKIRNALWDRVYNDKEKRIRELAVVGLTKRKDRDVIEIAKKQFLKNYDEYIMSALWDFDDLAILSFLRAQIKNIPTDNQEWITKIELLLDERIQKKEDIFIT